MAAAAAALNNNMPLAEATNLRRTALGRAHVCLSVSAARVRARNFTAHLVFELQLRMCNENPPERRRLCAGHEPASWGQLYWQSNDLPLVAERQASNEIRPNEKFGFFTRAGSAQALGRRARVQGYDRLRLYDLRRRTRASKESYYLKLSNVATTTKKS